MFKREADTKGSFPLQNKSRRDMLKSFGLGFLAFSAGAATRGVERVFAQNLKSEALKSYALPELPYRYDALAPAIDASVLKLHHTKHHAGYVRGLNATLKKLEEARAQNDFSQIKSLSRNLAFHGSGHVLHSLYWENMAPKAGNEPKGKLADLLKRDFGSVKAFRNHFLTATKKVEGSGWGILAYEPLGGRLLVFQAEKHQNLTVWGVVPLLICDVWEHAYYDQYQNRRAEYVDNFYTIINWPVVEKRLNAALT